MSKIIGDGEIESVEIIGFIGDDVLWQAITPDGRCVVARCPDPPERWNDATWWDVASPTATDWLAQRSLRRRSDPTMVVWRNEPHHPQWITLAAMPFLGGPPLAGGAAS
jgi:hypothetical protein